ncbi:hypothetical protein [Polaribacter sp.]|nr:hypothetical protein [Polaribacter sp.]
MIDVALYNSEYLLTINNYKIQDFQEEFITMGEVIEGRVEEHYD